MNKIMFIAVAAVSAFAIAAPQKNIIVKKATLNICPRSKDGMPLALGCRDSIQISKTKALHFDLDSSASNEVENCLNSVIGSNRFHNIRKSVPFEVEGFITKEKGQFPNPMVEFEIFHIVDSKDICSIPVPR